MRVFVAGISSERQYVKSLMSFYAMKIQAGDLRTESDDIRTIEFGKPGLPARKLIGSIFEQRTEYDALLLADLDMLFPADMLEKMRTHDVDMVTAHYFRRRADPMLSVVQIERDGWPYIPLIDIPTEGLHEVASSGFGAVLIKREPYMAVKESLPDKGHPFDSGPLPWLTGDHGHFGQDVSFFALARNLGFKLYLDASIECEHGHTSWLNRKLYKLLGHKDKQSENWKSLFEQSKERNGMDAKTAQIRIEQLQMSRNEVHQELLKVQQEADRLKTQLVVIDGQLAERQMDLEKKE